MFCGTQGCNREKCMSLPEMVGTLFCLIRKESGLFLCDGREYGNGYGFLRLNLACRREVVREGMERLKKSIVTYLEQNGGK